MSVLENAIAQFEARPTFEIEVPEWGKPDAPLVVYYKTPNAATLSKVIKESKGDPIEQAARLVAHCARDGKGEKMFNPIDYKDLMIKVDFAIVSRIAAAIMRDARFDVGEAEKNSEAIQPE